MRRQAGRTVTKIFAMKDLAESSFLSLRNESGSIAEQNNDEDAIKCGKRSCFRGFVAYGAGRAEVENGSIQADGQCRRAQHFLGCGASPFPILRRETAAF